MEIPKYETDCWGSSTFPGQIDWEKIDSYKKSYLSKIGSVIVDGANVEVTISVADAIYTEKGDDYSDAGIKFKSEVFTPDGDGCYEVFVGKLEGIGKVLLVAFDRDEDDQESETSQ